MCGYVRCASVFWVSMKMFVNLKVVVCDWVGFVGGDVCVLW